MKMTKPLVTRSFVSSLVLLSLASCNTAEGLVQDLAATTKQSDRTTVSIEVPPYRPVIASPTPVQVTPTPVVPRVSPSPVTTVQTPVVPQSTDFSFNATVRPDSHCRTGAGQEFQVKITLQRGQVSLDKNPVVANNGGVWYRENYQDCYLHDSVFRWSAR
jgi:predicted small secreted protein